MADRSWISVVVVGAVAVVLFYVLSKGGGVSVPISVTPTQTGPDIQPTASATGESRVGGSGLAITEIYSPSYTSTQNTEIQNTTTNTRTTMTTLKLLGLFQ